MKQIGGCILIVLLGFIMWLIVFTLIGFVGCFIYSSLTN